MAGMFTKKHWLQDIIDGWSRLNEQGISAEPNLRLDKTPTIWQTIFSDAHSWMISFVFD